MTDANETEPAGEEGELVSLEDIQRMYESSGLERAKIQRELGVVNPIMLAKFLKVRPQMIYNYIRNGKIKAWKTNNTQKIVIDASEADRFAREYLDKKARKQAQIELELQGKG